MSSREEKLMIRLDSQEKEALEELANTDSLPAATWARMHLLRLARHVGERNAAEMPRGRGIELLSLFCGAGGLDEGFRQAGFFTRLAFDIDQECVNSFALNHPDSIVQKADLRDLAPSYMDGLTNGILRPVGVVGGPPCQSFSVSNVHQKDDDPRHNLPETYASLLRELNGRHPISFFVFENVPGLLGKKHRYRYERFKSLFHESGFEIYENLLDAQDYGVPQERPRIFIVGINRKLHPLSAWTPPQPERSAKTVRDTIDGLPDPLINRSGLDPDDFPVHPNHWCMVPRSTKFSRKGMLKEGQAYGRSFRTLSWNKPSWTVAYGHREVHVHPNGHRRLSIYEAMLLQSFPPYYRLTGNISAQVRLVSEAVPPRLAWHLAVAIRRSLGI